MTAAAHDDGAAKDLGDPAWRTVVSPRSAWSSLSPDGTSDLITVDGPKAFTKS